MEAGEAEDNIRAIVEANGRISFAQFMQLALYGPGGYYRQVGRIGAAGDFFTSPHAHPVFGALIGLQLEQMWQLMGRPGRFDVVEPGAASGRMAEDIMSFVGKLNEEFTAALTYVALDGWNSELPAGINGCVLSNELVDAFPVHRVKRTDGKLLEIYVTLDRGQFVEELDEPSTAEIGEQLASEGVELGEGWTAEVSLESTTWMRSVASRLDRGYVITIDYGDAAEHLYADRRRNGTLMSYYRHTKGTGPYSRIGSQDLTAHVDFTALIEAGKSQGLFPVTLMTQREFLTNLGAEMFLQVTVQSTTTSQADVKGLRSILDPAGLGDFRVLVQSKKTPVKELACLGLRATHRGALAKHFREGLQVPRLSDAHLDQLAGRPSGWLEWRSNE